MKKPNGPILEVKIKNNMLVISIGVEALAFAAEHGEDEFVKFGGHPKYKISHPEGFARDVLSELCREEEDGTTPVHELLDAAMLKAIENGSLYAHETRHFQFEKDGDNYRANCTDEPGSPTIGIGKTKMEALAALLFNIINDKGRRSAIEDCVPVILEEKT